MRMKAAIRWTKTTFSDNVELKKYRRKRDVRIYDRRFTGYSADYIRRKFRAETGMTPGEYLTGLRINFARELLERRGSLKLSVNDLSLMCGFYDVRYFSRVFRKITGCAPSRYVGNGEVNKK